MPFFAPKISLELDEGEQVLLIRRHHWVLLLRRNAIPLAIALLLLIVIAYRAIGGSFLTSSTRDTNLGSALLEPINLLLLVAIGVVLFFWARVRGKNPKKPPVGWPYLIGLVLLGVLLVFRLQGGRVFYVDQFASSGPDGLNLVLIMIVIASVLLIVYNLIDWRDDSMIVTTTRVVYDDQDFLIRHLQRQILIDDIQQVSIKADDYFKYWLGYGTVTVQSFSPQRLQVEFLSDPDIIQKTIMGEVNKLRKAQEPAMLQRMIEDQVYGNKPPPTPSNAIHVKEKPSPIVWLFPQNPQVDHASETVTWRPAWIYVIQKMFQPIGLLLVVTIVALVLLGLQILPLGLALLGWLPLALVAIGWIYWIREEYVNDVYILTRKDITDVDKRPFGPESRRRAALGAIQDISFDIGFIENLLGYGSVIIQTGGGGANNGKFTFNHVPDPRGVQATINDYLTDFRKREKAESLQMTMTVLKQYHNSQLTHEELVNKTQLFEHIRSTIREEMPASSPTPPMDEVYEQARKEARITVRTELLRLLRRRRRRLP